ncbi:MAG: hypothetical protein FWC41_11025 [Firmicutes bacterium]|nr:hypothetical protein [Bacillota bacterium]
MIPVITKCDGETSIHENIKNNIKKECEKINKVFVTSCKEKKCTNELKEYILEKAYKLKEEKERHELPKKESNKFLFDKNEYKTFSIMCVTCSIGAVSLGVYNFFKTKRGELLKKDK